MTRVVGIDCGGTKSVALWVDGNGDLLAERRAAGANPTVDDLDRVREVLTDLLAADDVSSVDAVCVGMSGAGRRRARLGVEQVLRDLGARGAVRVVHDARIALRAVSRSGAGIALISGTGSVAFGRGLDGSEARAGGWGPRVGDEGSAYWLVREALRRCLHALDGRGPTTILGEGFERRLGRALPDGVLSWIYGDQPARSEVAALLPVIGEAAQAGDQVAEQLIAEGAAALAGLATAIARRLEFGEQPYELVLTGGTFLGCRQLEMATRRQLGGHPLTEMGHTALLERHPAWGAVFLAMDELRGGSSAVDRSLNRRR